MAIMTAMCLFILSVSGSTGQNIFSSELSNIRRWQSGDEGEPAKRGGGEMLEPLLDREGDGGCYGRSCQHPEECCKGTTCVNIGGVSGTCLPSRGRPSSSYQSCRDDSDCGVGLVCAESGGRVGNTCQLDTGSVHKRGSFNDDCATSSECDESRGLCCQVLRRHRMASRRACHYFVDPRSCVGELRTDARAPTFVANPFFKARMG